jgi:hypothetical protein
MHAEATMPPGRDVIAEHIPASLHQKKEFLFIRQVERATVRELAFTANRKHDGQPQELRPYI